ncbi:hypothetical protein V6N13_147500 [Hibiscus sabdariffa]
MQDKFQEQWWLLPASDKAVQMCRVVRVEEQYVRLETFGVVVVGHHRSPLSLRQLIADVNSVEAIDTGSKSACHCSLTVSQPPIDFSIASFHYS